MRFVVRSDHDKEIHMLTFTAYSNNYTNVIATVASDDREAIATALNASYDLINEFDTRGEYASVYVNLDDSNITELCYGDYIDTDLMLDMVESKKK
jgi:hypothetical protein